jgi:hypothetical protein
MINTNIAVITKAMAAQMAYMKRAFLGVIRIYVVRIDILVNPDANANRVWPAMDTCRRQSSNEKAKPAFVYLSTSDQLVKCEVPDMLVPAI